MQHIFDECTTMTDDRLTPESFGQLLRQKRGSMGVRAAAGEIGISHSTLSRIENGHVPDLETLRRICTWMGIDPVRYLGVGTSSPSAASGAVQVVFRKNQAVRPETSQALGALILAAYDKFSEMDADGHQ